MCLFAIVYDRISKFPCCVISKVVVVHKIGEVENWNAYSIAYSLSNNCTKNYYNRAINIRIMLK